MLTARVKTSWFWNWNALFSLQHRCIACSNTTNPELRACLIPPLVKRQEPTERSRSAHSLIYWVHWAWPSLLGVSGICFIYMIYC